MDVVYIVRVGQNNEQLRYSLRSLDANGCLDSGARLWVVGFKPDWLTNCVYVVGNRHGASKARNVYDNVRLACAQGGLSDRFLMMNDDFYLLEPVEEHGVLFRGLLKDHIALHQGGWFRESLVSAQQYLASVGIVEPLSYDLHVPLPVEREGMAKVLDEAAHFAPANPPQWRTLYGNICGIGGTQAPADVKVQTPGASAALPDLPYASTDAGSWTRSSIGRWVRQAFPNPSRWER